MLHLLIVFVIGVVIIGGLYWVCTLVPLPPPVGQRGIQIVFGVVFFIWVLICLISLAQGASSLSLGLR